MSASLCTPWRSVWLPRAVTAVALVVAIPLFLRSPPWCDITLYQLAARNLLDGGTHYRDLFDTNLPGFVWAMTALGTVFGQNVIVVRALDLLIVLGVVLLLDRLVKWGGATLAGRWWVIAGAAMFYPFTVEMSHAQRDTWMALPGFAAVVLRARRGIGAPAPAAPAGTGAGTPSPFRQSVYEGLLWGAAVWMKPHIVLMALVVWLLTARRLADGQKRPWRAAAADLLGNLVGGLAVGLPGVVWLIASGTWGPFYDVFTFWNPRYMELAASELHWRLKQELHWFPPWSLCLVVTVPLALLSVLDMAPWQSRARAAARPTGWLGRWLPRHLWDKSAGADERFVRGVLGGLYLTWAAQAFFVQRGFEYAHIPETLLMFGVWATHRWAWVPVVFVWLAVTSGIGALADVNPAVQNGFNGWTAEERRRYLPRHLITDPDRLRLWPQCWRFAMSDAERYQLWDRLRLHPPHEASIGWEELGEVAEFLRAAPRGDGTTGVRDGEVIAWFDSPHAVYLMLGIKPGFRYMHVYTAVAIFDPTDGRPGREHVLQALRKNRDERGQKYLYVISDLEWVALAAGNNPVRRAQFLGPARNPNNPLDPCGLLPVFSPYPDEFPFNQPTVFRTRNGTGRYIVHRVVTLDDRK
jgi:hypothetical protein